MSSKRVRVYIIGSMVKLVSFDVVSVCCTLEEPQQDVKC